VSYLLDTDILIDWLRDQHFARRLILFIRNHKHYDFIEEITLVGRSACQLP
jgi:hypothetical protein